MASSSDTSLTALSKFCGNPQCHSLLEKIRVCAVCRSRSYCSKLCQGADWIVHREFCSPVDGLSSSATLIRAYARKHQNMFITLALEHMQFASKFSPLRGDDRLAFLPLSQAQYLHIKLHRRTDITGRARVPRYSRIAFASAELRNASLLPTHAAIRRRLVERFPAVILGYSIVDRSLSLDSPQMITTYTHPFRWPETSIFEGRIGLGIPKIISIISLMEWYFMHETGNLQDQIQ